MLTCLKHDGPTYLFGRDRCLRSLVQLFNGFGIMTKILLATNKDNGEALAEVQNFRDPLDHMSATITTEGPSPCS